MKTKLRNKFYKILINLGLKYDREGKRYFPTEEFLLGNTMENNILDDVIFREIGDCIKVTIITCGGISGVTADTYIVRSEEDLTKISGFIKAALQGFEPPVMEGGVV